MSLKFYEHEPFWKIVVFGDHVWVQYCHSGCEIKREPEYIFALNRKHPRQGFFVPFYVHCLEQWSDSRHAEYDFDTGELVYRDADGNEIRRTDFCAGGGGQITVAPPLPAGAAAATDKSIAQHATASHEAVVCGSRGDRLHLTARGAQLPQSNQC